MFCVKAGPDGALQLIGVIDDSVDLAKAFEQHAGDLTMNCREVTRINSMGIKAWRDFFLKRRQKGAKLVFKEISPPLVEQIGFISDFILFEEIESLCLPLLCEKCSSPDLEVGTPAQVKQMDLNNISKPCPKCGGNLIFDELPEQYLAFLE